MTAKEGLRVAMEKKERHFKKEIETLEFQISDLQTSLHRNEQQGNRREDNLRQEISDVQQVKNISFINTIDLKVVSFRYLCQ